MGFCQHWTHLKIQRIKTFRDPLWSLVPWTLNIWCPGNLELIVLNYITEIIQTPKLVLYSTPIRKLLILVTERSYPSSVCDLAVLILKLLRLDSFLVFFSCGVTMTEPETGHFNIHSHLCFSLPRSTTLHAFLACLVFKKGCMI